MDAIRLRTPSAVDLVKARTVCDQTSNESRSQRHELFVPSSLFVWPWHQPRNWKIHATTPAILERGALLHVGKRSPMSVKTVGRLVFLRGNESATVGHGGPKTRSQRLAVRQRCYADLGVPALARRWSFHACSFRVPHSGCPTSLMMHAMTNASGV